MDENFNTPIQPEGVAEAPPVQPQHSAPMGTNPAQNAPFYPNQPTFNSNYQPVAPNTGFNNYTYPNNPQQNSQPAPKKKKKTGKSVFAILLCICIVVASVAIGISFKGGIGGVGEENSKPADTNTTNNDAAAPNIEDSPVDYSEYSGEGIMTPEQIYDYVKNINVAIIVYSQNQKIGEGSGIIVGEDATKKYTYIITCAHVIADKGVDVQVQLIDGSEIDAEIVGLDNKTDVGVVKIKKTGLKAATFGDSDKLMVGQAIYAIGNPGGTEFFGSFTNGIISAIDRPIASSASAYDLPCIQHNAAINPGNSGGALVNAYGQVIGLNSSKITSTEYEGMGFSVPSNTMLEIYNSIVKHGYVTNRPMLGITYYAVANDYNYSAIAWKNNLPYGSIVIASITDGSGIANSGIQIGDIITGVNGAPLNSTDTLLEVIENSSVGDTITLTYCRLNNNGSVASTATAKVKLVEDKGNNSQPATSVPETDPFSNYFGY